MDGVVGVVGVQWAELRVRGLSMSSGVGWVGVLRLAMSVGAKKRRSRRGNECRVKTVNGRKTGQKSDDRTKTQTRVQGDNRRGGNQQEEIFTGLGRVYETPRALSSIAVSAGCSEV